MDDDLEDGDAMEHLSKPVSELRQLFATVLFNNKADSHHIVFRAEDVDIHLKIGAGKPRVIVGQMLQRRENRFLIGVPIGLSQGGEPIEGAITDSLGEFRFENVPSGALRIHADLPVSRLFGDFTVNER